MTRKFIIPLTLVTTLVTVSGCNSLRHTFGLDHYQADEFSIPSNPPLSMPPDYDLQPPKPGAKGPGHVSHQEIAQEKLLGQRLKAPATSDGQTEKEIIEEAEKKTTVEPNIREKINREATVDSSGVDTSKPVLDRITDNLTGKTSEVATTSPATTKPTGN